MAKSRIRCGGGDETIALYVRCACHAVPAQETEFNTSKKLLMHRGCVADDTREGAANSACLKLCMALSVRRPEDQRIMPDERYIYAVNCRTQSCSVATGPTGLCNPVTFQCSSLEVFGYVLPVSSEHRLELQLPCTIKFDGTSKKSTPPCR